MTYNFDKCQFTGTNNPTAQYPGMYCIVHRSYESGPSGICEAAILEYGRETWSAQHYGKCRRCGSTEYEYMPLRCARCGAGGAPEDRGWQWMVGSEDQVDQV